MRALFLMTLLSAWFAASAHAQSGRCEMTVDRAHVALTDVFRLDVNCSVEGAQAEMPELDLSDFDVVQRQFSRPMSFTFGGGGVQTVVQSSVRLAMLLRPRREGTFTLGPARLAVGRTTVESQPLSIQVGGSGTTAPPTPSPPASPPTGQLDGAVYDDQAFIRSVVDREEAFVGQQITVTYYLYVRSIASSPQVTRQPSTDGFWIHDLLDRTSTHESVQRVGNTTFRVYPIRRFAAIPLRAGELTLTPMEMQIPVGSPIDIVFGGGGGGVVSRTSNPVTLRVRALPPVSNPGLASHVGSLEAAFSADRTQVPTGDAVTLDLRLTGDGHVESLPTPTLAVDGLQFLQPEVEQQTEAPNEAVRGEKHVRWLVVAQRPGTFTIGPLTWSVFDPGSSTWSTVTAAAITLTAAGNAVTPVDEPETTTSAPSTPRPEAMDAFGPVRTESAFRRRSPSVTSGLPFRVAAGLIPAVGIGLIALARWRRRRSEPDKKSESSRALRDRTAKVEAALASGDERGSHGAILAFLRATLEARLDESVGSLTHAQLRARLISRGMATDLADRVVARLEACEAARFAPGGAPAADAWSDAKALSAALGKFSPTEVS